ncbi:Putative D-isomer specific 2-hydroxyacid dehydrogenase, NAD-binding domain-containing protein [Septoria linicola]|uniref:D-isomer specific 2-hydroxyacid dehydrogenase, NAD-binding domain-containing protein n=1 Tax=Septoria linicola TaxID=215465 RepID=A0A9Q9AY44_9PEZI|nr:Putative D-isomer specific 2-hydroxyacid dehydrogenase, NAD-binding domain-containing protein [Septoria linicola]
MGGGAAKDTLLAVLPFPEPKDIIDSLRKKFPGLDINYVQTNFSRDVQQLRQQVPAPLWNSATILVTLFTVPSPQEAPKLELIHLVSAGSNQLQKTPIYTDTDITITTSSGIHGPQIAEWVVLTALAQSHGYNQLYELQKKRQWGDKRAAASNYNNVRDWVGRRVGILGYGSIGRQVGRVAKAMGMEVVAFTATPKETPEKKRDHGFIVPGTGDEKGEVPVEWYSGLEKENLHKFLTQDLDWLVVAVPLTDQTRHFLSKEEFRVLSHDGKKPAFVTNIARGQIIDQPALIEALKDGTLSGAALDVTDPEPLPEDSELWGMENVIVTPHVSGNGVAYTERTFKILEQNLERREHGEKLINIVRRSRGY